MKKPDEIVMRPFDCHIPNPQGGNSLAIIRIEIPVRVDPDTEEEILTPEAHELIDRFKTNPEVVKLIGKIKGLCTEGKELKDRYFTPAELLAAASDFMPCPECGAVRGHAPDCSSTPREDLAQAYRDAKKGWREDNSRFIKRICDLTTQVTLWQGKHAIVRHENNKLRAKVAHYQSKPRVKKTKAKK